MDRFFKIVLFFAQIIIYNVGCLYATLTLAFLKDPVIIIVSLHMDVCGPFFACCSIVFFFIVSFIFEFLSGYFTAHLLCVFIVVHYLFYCLSSFVCIGCCLIVYSVLSI